MLITDVQERIMNVFSRATKSLSKEIQDINVSGPLQERIPLYTAIETDFKGYSLLGKDLVIEVRYNISSSLRPAERSKYMNNLQSYLDQVRDGYDYLESDEWIDKMFASFKVFMVFNPLGKKVDLTEEDKKCIFKIAEEVRVCCHKYIKAVDELTAESPEIVLPGFEQNFGYVDRSQKNVAPQQNPNPNLNNKPVVTPNNQVPQTEETEKSVLRTLPPKILLLDKLGFFKLPEVQRLSWESKGKLVSALCGGSADNAVDYIRQCDPERLALEKNPYRNASNINLVQDLLNSLKGI